MWWVDLGCLPALHAVALSFFLINRPGRENKMDKLVGQDKGNFNKKNQKLYAEAKQK